MGRDSGSATVTATATGSEMVTVNSSETVKAGGSETATVGGSETETVDGPETETVDSPETVAADGLVMTVGSAASVAGGSTRKNGVETADKSLDPKSKLSGRECGYRGWAASNPGPM